MPDSIIRILDGLFSVFYLVLTARILLTWIPVQPGGLLADIIDVLNSLTEPLLAPIRKIIPPIPLGMGYLDLSPLILMLLVNFLRRLLH
ncbi:MAG: YggT family protein [Eubacteriales bacterium]|nr:YggT family protein [Eubacteriales bacterium]